MPVTDQVNPPASRTPQLVAPPPAVAEAEDVVQTATNDVVPAVASVTQTYRRSDGSPVDMTGPPDIIAAEATRRGMVPVA